MIHMDNQGYNSAISCFSPLGSARGLTRYETVSLLEIVRQWLNFDA